MKNGGLPTKQNPPKDDYLMRSNTTADHAQSREIDPQSARQAEPYRSFIVGGAS